MTYGGDGLYREAALMDGDEDIFRPAGLGGDGWWDDAVKETKRVAKRVQKSKAVRGLEKRAVRAGADVLRGAATAATDGLADSALTSLGAPELAPLADKLISRGAKSLEKKGVDYLDQKIDASGRGYGGVRYMSPAGGGLRLAESGGSGGRRDWRLRHCKLRLHGRWIGRRLLRRLRNSAPFLIKHTLRGLNAIRMLYRC